ncbi:ROK family protein [Pelagibacteraceae bacterium]|nr:ROK family protein [Pelagibacteraceae bacterium]
MSSKKFNNSGIAVDFGASKISISEIVKGKFKNTSMVLTKIDKKNKDYIHQIIKNIDNVKKTKPKKIGIAITGRVDKLGNWYPVNKKNLGSFKIPIKRIIEKRYDIPIKIMNDATAAALGESIYGKGHNYKRVGYITISTGIGVGVILNKKPFISENGLAGHLGFTTSTLGKMKCGSGRIGTFESIASGKAMSKIASLKGYKNITAKEIFQKNKNKRKWAREIIELSAKSISELCSNLKATFDLDIIILGGSIGMANGYAELVKKNLRKEPKLFHVKLVKSSLGTKAAKLGVLA